jgi:hypothetical protein
MRQDVNEDQEEPKPRKARLARLIEEARELAAEEKRRWGGVDELMEARYEEGLCTPEERERVERAMREHPLLRESMEQSRKFFDKKGITSRKRDLPVANAQGKRNPGASWAERTDDPETGAEKTP